MTESTNTARPETSRFTPETVPGETSTAQAVASSSGPLAGEFPLQSLNDDASPVESETDATATHGSSEHIVKVQLPLNTTESHPQMLVYSEDRKTIFLYAWAPERFARELKRYPRKGYFRATLHGLIVDIHERVEDRAW